MGSHETPSSCLGGAQSFRLAPLGEVVGAVLEHRRRDLVLPSYGGPPALGSRMASVASSAGRRLASVPGAPGPAGFAGSPLHRE